MTGTQMNQKDLVLIVDLGFYLIKIGFLSKVSTKIVA